MRRINVEKFSDSYYILPDASYVSYTGDRVVAATDFMAQLEQLVGAPLTKVAGGHYWLEPEGAVPPEVVAIPSDVIDVEEQPVLVAKPGIARRMVEEGVVPEP